MPKVTSSAARLRHGMAAIQSVMLVALASIMMVGVSGYFGSANGVSGHTSDAVARLFSGESGAGQGGGGTGSSGGIEIVPRPSRPGAGGTGPSGSASAAARAAHRDRLDELVSQYEQIAANCRGVSGNNVGHSCVLQHQMLELARQTRDEAAANPEKDFEWIANVLEFSLPNIDDLGANPASWWTRWKSAFTDARLQVVDAAATPLDFLLKLRGSEGISDAWRKALNNSLFNWGDTGAIRPGAQHFAKDLYPGFIEGARKVLDRAISEGATEADLKRVIQSIEEQHKWLLEKAVPGGFDGVTKDGNVGSASAWTAKQLVPPGAKLLRHVMWSEVLPERGLSHLNPNGSPAQQAASINQTLWEMHDKGHVPRPRFDRDHDFDRWLFENPNGSNPDAASRRTVETLLRLID